MNKDINIVKIGKEIMKNCNEKKRRGRKPKQIDFNFANQPFTVKNVCDRNKVTKPTAQNRINEMIANNKLEVFGKSEGRGRPNTFYCWSNGADVQKTTPQDFAPYAVLIVLDIEKVALAHEANGGIAVSEID